MTRGKASASPSCASPTACNADVSAARVNHAGGAGEGAAKRRSGRRGTQGVDAAGEGAGGAAGNPDKKMIGIPDGRLMIRMIDFRYFFIRWV